MKRKKLNDKLQLTRSFDRAFHLIQPKQDGSPPNQNSKQ